ncbi:MAG: hypothetical protein NZ902_04635 [Acidilobaceae archaeon]|nr:hypothetical protein [Acidilobaceae archaeon]MCX8164985.1 hypothetical protein [Acidilobaceae archaeon]MDW7974498.1 hypothetical protein [Sulfolobales archaeon]
MTKWRLKCEECSREWELEVSFDLSEFSRLYHYCRFCRKNTYHAILAKIDS